MGRVLTTQLELGTLGTRALRLTLDESRRYRELTGVSLVRHGINLLELDEDAFAQLVWVCAFPEGADVAVAEVRRELDGTTFIAAFRAIEQLIAAYFPEAAAEVAVGDPTRPPRPTLMERVRQIVRRLLGRSTPPTS